VTLAMMVCAMSCDVMIFMPFLLHSGDVLRDACVTLCNGVMVCAMSHDVMIIILLFVMFCEWYVALW
jgi:hypothetical protein